MNKALQLSGQWDKTFPLSEKVEHRKVTFHNRYGVTLAGDLYTPRARREGFPLLPCAVLSGQ